MFDQQQSTIPRLPSIKRGISSVSPKSSLIKSQSLVRTKKIEEPAPLPLPAIKALQLYKNQLTVFERKEIAKYPTIYFVGKRRDKLQARQDTRGKNNYGFDDEGGRYKSMKHDHIAYRFEIIKGLGKGSFGDVVKTYDHKNGRYVAIKIIRNERRFHKQAQSEVKILDLLKENDIRNNHNVIHMGEHFLFRNHLCITFELLHGDLYSELRKNGFRGFSLSNVNKFCQNLLQTLRVLGRHSIVHCDLKPENILLKQKDRTGIKVIDFGSSCFESEKVHTYIQSRYYRSPEVIMGAEYGTGIDMWSLGCILVELLTGRPLFSGRDEKEQIVLITEVLGAPNKSFLARCRRGHLYFDSTCRPIRIRDNKDEIRSPRSVLMESLVGPIGAKDRKFVDFLYHCLTWDPEDRFTPRDAIRHPWIQDARARSALSKIKGSSSGPIKGSKNRGNTVARSQSLPIHPECLS